MKKLRRREVKSLARLVSSKAGTKAHMPPARHCVSHSYLAPVVGTARSSPRGTRRSSRPPLLPIHPPGPPRTPACLSASESVSALCRVTSRPLSSVTSDIVLRGRSDEQMGKLRPERCGSTEAHGVRLRRRLAEGPECPALGRVPPSVLLGAIRPVTVDARMGGSPRALVRRHPESGEPPGLSEPRQASAQALAHQGTSVHGRVGEGPWRTQVVVAQSLGVHAGGHACHA